MKGVVVGLGVMGRHHLRVLTSLGAHGVSVEAVADPDPAARERARSELPHCRAYADLNEALAREELDFACIATPMAHLAPSAIEALHAGLDVLVEKPMAADLREAQRLVTAAEAVDRKVMVGLVERCNPAVRALKTRLAHGQGGRVMQMHARRLSPFPNRMSMSGVALDLGTHDIDVMRFLSGADVERVFAETASLEGSAGEDLVCSTLRFEGGITGLLETNWISPVKVRQLSVTCEHGMFVVDYLSQDLTFFEHPTAATAWEPLRGLRGGGEGDMTRYAIDRWEPLRVEWESFLDVATSSDDGPARPTDGYAAISVAEAIRKSGHENRAVGLSTAILEHSFA